MEKVNIIVGRFQPFTLGHLNCIKSVYNETGIRSIILVINSKIDEKHPFNKELITKMLKSIILTHKHCCADFLFINNADIVLNAELLRKNGYEPISWVCGTDRFQSYNNMVIKYLNKANLTTNFKVFCVNRYIDLISATSVRNALKMGNNEVFINNTPQCIHYLYTELKKCLIM